MHEKENFFVLKKPFFLFLSTLLLNNLSCFSLANRQAKQFFGQETQKGEAFRVFISREDYIVKQIQYEEQVRRSEDTNGDREKKEFFMKEHDKINFKDFTLAGTLAVDLNFSGQPVNIQYVRGETPRTWQASKHFIQDIARFRFIFPNPEKSLYSFRVRYLWSIAAPLGLSASARKRRAIKYLRNQRRE